MTRRVGVGGARTEEEARKAGGTAALWAGEAAGPRWGLKAGSPGGPYPRGFESYLATTGFHIGGVATPGQPLLGDAQRKPCLGLREPRVGHLWRLVLHEKEEAGQSQRLRPWLDYKALNPSDRLEGLSQAILLRPPPISLLQFGRGGQGLGRGFEKKSIPRETTCSECG